MAHVWIAMHGWSTIPEFYYLMCFFNLILKLCLYCKLIILFLFFVFDSVFLLFSYLFLLISWTIIFVQNSSRRQEEYLGIYIADFEQLISDDIVWRMLEGISS